MSQDSATAETELNDRSKRRSEKRRHDSEHSDELLENNFQALHEPLVHEEQGAFQEEGEHLQNHEDNQYSAVNELCEKVNKVLADVQECRSEQELRVPEMREAFLAKMAEVFDQSVENARARWDAAENEIGQLVSEIGRVLQHIEEKREKRENLRRAIRSAWDALV